MKKRGERLSEMARALGKSRWRGVSKEERVERARELAKLRWAKATDQDRERARQNLARARRKRWSARRSEQHGETRSE